MNLIERIKSGEILSSAEYNQLFMDYKKYGVDDTFINVYADKLDWGSVLAFYPLSEEILRRNMYRFRNNALKILLSSRQILSPEFIRDYRDDLLWIFISTFQKLDEKLIRDFEKYIDFGYLPYYQDISLSLLEDLNVVKQVYWTPISRDFPLKEEFILEYFVHLDKSELQKNKALELTDAVKLLIKLN